MIKKTEEKNHQLMDNIVSLCKRRGFIYQGSEIYGGLAGTWDYGPLGVALKNNVKNLWWKRFVDDRDDIYAVDAAILMNQEVWKTTGHVGGFSDPLVKCKNCNSVFRADQIGKEIVIDGVKTYQFEECSKCHKKNWDNPTNFNMMFQTKVGASEDSSSISYLRPETAQGMFVNYKNILDSFHPKLPFGMAQIGKAFRNEIAPRDFTFRTREFEQMEIEYLIKPPRGDEWNETFDYFKDQMMAYIKDIGLSPQNIHLHEIEEADRAFYSKRTIDFEYDFPFGRKELYGLAYRTNYDLGRHADASGSALDYYDEETKERYTPHCIEPSFGLDRTILALISEAYCEDELGGEKRVYLKFAPKVAPIKIAVFPLLKNKPELIKKAQEIYSLLRKEFGVGVMFDDNGNIGKRYRRQDEIGTPFCITIDFDTVEKNEGVTVRDRDTGKQERISEKDLVQFFREKLI